MYFIYDILYFIVLLFMLPSEYFRRAKDLRKRWLTERCGFPDLTPAAGHTSLIWVHAVSVGEVIAAVPLIKKLKEKYPSGEIVISTVTDTGQKVARERAGELAEIIYVSFDLSFSVRSAISCIRPSLLIIMETELWPNMLRVSRRAGVPVLLMNGRISDKSFKGYRRLRFFMTHVLDNVDLFCMQDKAYAEMIKLMGAAPERVKAIGNFKFDTRPSSPVPEWTNILGGPVLIAGSTHRTEEDLIIDAYVKLREDFPLINLIIASRHPERFGEVEELLKNKGLEYIKRSEIGKGTVPDLRTLQSKVVESGLSPSAETSGLIVLLDVIGELSSVYGAADIAVMGGSFIDHGGQNPLEPAYWGKAVVCGPHMENFHFMDEFYEKGGALKADAATLYQALKGLLSAPERLSLMGNTARELYDKNTGATDRAVGIIAGYL